ncbi:STAS domain-containing protein [Candidatus Margulisiibacteriota bacterium]
MVLDLKINIKKDKGIPVIILNGEIDVYTYPQLNEAMEKIIHDGNYNIVINLEDVRYIDSTGLGVLANSASKILTHKGQLNIVCTKPQVRKIFMVSGLMYKNLSLFDNEGTALSNLRKNPAKATS